MNNLSDREQIDAIKKWWKENGTSIVVGLVLGVGGIIGYQMWDKHSTDQKRETSAAYTEALSDSKKAEAFLNSGNDGVYGINLALSEATKAVQANNLSKAKAHLNWVIERANDDAYMVIATLNLAKVWIAENDAQKALDTLAGVENFASFKAQAMAIKGDAFKLAGQRIEAKAAYNEAISNLEPSSSLIRILQLKINNLQ